MQRLLGYSSIGQMGLLMMAARAAAADRRTRHRFRWWSAACSSIICSPRPGCSGWPASVGESASTTGPTLPRRPLLHRAVLAVLIVAIAGLPPFPGFWAKWQLVMQLAAGER